MNFLCSSDLHGVVPVQMKSIVKERKIDAILYGGDLSPHGWFGGEGESAEAPLEFMLGLGLPFFLVNGNIDPDMSFFENAEKRHGNLHFVHLRRVKFGKYYVVGLGDYLYPFTGADYALKMFRSLLEKSPEKTIVISHYPPRGVADMTDTGVNAGKKELMKIIEEFRPPVFLCGHIHEAAGIARLGETTVINAAMKTVLLEMNDGEVNVSLV